MESKGDTVHLSVLYSSIFRLFVQACFTNSLSVVQSLFTIQPCRIRLYQIGLHRYANHPSNTCTRTGTESGSKRWFLFLRRTQNVNLGCRDPVIKEHLAQ
ncbi:hypothetical protein R3I94_022630 [Phoxinus phoxinus]